MYHLSDIKKFLRCERLYYFGKDDNNVFKPFLRSDENIIDLIKEYFHIEECFNGIRNDGNDRFFSAINDYDWFIRPRFVDGELRINVPLMYKNENGFDLYFLYYGTTIKDLDVISYRSTLKVLDRLNVLITNVYLVYLDGNYVYEDKLEVDKLFIVTDEFKEKKIIDYLREDDFDYDSIIKKINSFDIEKSPAKKNRNCRLNGLCEHYEKCFPDEEELSDDSILTLVSSRNKNQMKEDGIELLKDADPARIEGNRVQYAQIMASKNNGLFIDVNALSKWLEKLDERPISFIDFEWDRYLVPAYHHMKPLDVLCFEFALYYIDEQGHMEHRTFVSTGDCRKEFVEALFEYLPDSGPILAYNAYGAECLRLQELAEVYPEYKNDLLDIVDRFVDMAAPFNEGLVYDTRMQGNFTLKKLVDICSEYSYEGLDIYDGMEAVFNWRDIDNNNDTEKQEILNNLKEYCSLDAYGLFLVYKWLIKLIIEYK